MELVQLIYCSAATKVNVSASELETILEVSRRNNEKVEITGILLYRDRSFFQVLEGDKEIVEALYEKICLDKRHDRIRKILIEPIEQKSFSAWTMGYPKITSKELAEIPGLNDFFSRGKTYLELEEGNAKTLLAAFKEGKWRTSIQ
jgi:Sensors of blue-light using FAD